MQASSDRQEKQSTARTGTQPVREPSVTTANWSAASNRKWRVLLVDDENGILSSLRRLLRREPYVIDLAVSGEEAVEKLRAEPAQVIVSDFRMPGMTGVELLRCVQKNWPDTVRVIMSGYSEVKAIISAINDGSIYKFITKPWNDEEVKLHLRRAVEQYELLNENRRMAEEITLQNERLRELNQRLDQQVVDAQAGQTLMQRLHEIIDVGVLTVDQGGLIVSANRRANEMMANGRGELMGTQANQTLPRQVYDAFFSSVRANRSNDAGELELGGISMQWRAQALLEGGEHLGSVFTLWEEVSCPSQ